MTQTDTPTPSETLQSVFGFPAFREGQEPVVEKLLDGSSVLAIFPTGAGKSLCYQLPALMLDGLTLVDLAADRADEGPDRLPASQGRRRGPAGFQRRGGRGAADVLRPARGQLKLLYVAPERLGSERFLQTLKRLNLSMLAVDEAHCITEWGHNFRPDYLKLAKLARELNVGARARADGDRHARGRRGTSPRRSASRTTTSCGPISTGPTSTCA